MVMLPCELMLGRLRVVVGTEGVGISAMGSPMKGRPMSGAALTPFTCMMPLLFQLPTISVLALPVLWIVAPPFPFNAAGSFELTKTPQPVVMLVLPLTVSAPLPVGFRVIIQPPELASRAPVVAR